MYGCTFYFLSFLITFTDMKMVPSSSGISEKVSMCAKIELPQLVERERERERKREREREREREKERERERER